MSHQQQLPVVKKVALTTGSSGRRGQRTMFPDTIVVGAAQPDRYNAMDR